MKKFKFLVAFVAILSLTINSCSDNNPVNEQETAEKSISLRATLNQIKKANNIAGRTTEDQAMCFDFVYPITLSYNNGTQVVVTSFNGLLDLLTQENENLYLEGIVFPFQVQQEGETLTINNEDDFNILIDNCGYNTISDDFYIFDCYDIVYPFSLITENNQTIVINNQQEFYNAITDENNYVVDFVYPISLIGNGQTIVVNNLYELGSILSECDSQGCVCPADYNPVCVNDPINFVTITFSNACQAECAGYTSADFVDCNGSGNYSQLINGCYNIVFPFQVQYQGAVYSVNSDAELAQYWNSNQSPYPNMVYPITVLFYDQTVVAEINEELGLIASIEQFCN